MISPRRRWLARAIEPQVLFPAFALLVLGVLWGLVLHSIRVERASRERASADASREILMGYEAQVLRSIREIDATLKFVKYAYEKSANKDILAELQERQLLPPAMLFEVSIADREGNLVASTRAGGVPNVAGREYFETQRSVDFLAVGVPRQDAETGEWTLRFSRRLSGPQDRFDGVVVVSVVAEYFVSGYSEAALGRKGLLGVLGTDGVFRARRVGDDISYGDSVNFDAVAGGGDAEDVRSYLAASSWDGVERYTSARKLYGLPLAAIVGLSREEQLAPETERARTYVRRAALASLGAIIVLGLLGRLSWQLAESRKAAVAEQIAHAQRIEYLAYHDGLTGLPNRSLFSKLLQQSIQQARRYDRKLAVLFLDLDRFKHINDTLGHEAGDELLREVARRLQACLRESDTVARLGGDEFVVLLPELTEETYVAGVAQKIITAIARPFNLLGQEFRVTGSVGISTHPSDGLDEQTLTKNADIAMYKAKEQGKNNFQFYSEQMNVDSLERLTLETGLRHALERDEFELHYQAKRDLRTGRISGTEALLRWRHPDLGLVAPMQFIPVAEQSGLMMPIGRWVMRTACRQSVTWRNEGLPRLSMAVNLTERQFLEPSLLSDVAGVLAETQMEAGLLELEISESMLMRDVDHTLQVLTGLKRLGVRVAVDDFGFGYATLSALQQFPLDTIKIDRSFIRTVDHVQEDKELADAVIAMGRSLSMTVVAQGVETRAQAEFLQQHACDELQGFYFNRPIPAGDFGELLRRQDTAIGVMDFTAHTAKRA